MYCQKCGQQIENDTQICSNCGASVNGPVNQGQNQQGQYNNYAPVDPRKSRLVAGILQIFIGGFGVGRFYLGYTGIGVAQLLVTIFTCGLGAIWPFVDGILILTGQVETDADGNTLKD